MNKKMLAISLIIVVVMLSGCWDKVEINDRAYVISLGLDDIGEELQVTYTIPNLPVLTGLGSGEATKFIKVTEADTLFQANKEFGKRSNLKINFDHTKVVIFGKDFLTEEDNIRKVLDHFDRNPEYAKSLLMLATKGSARELLESVPNGEETTGIYLSQVFINNSADTIRANVIELGSLIIELYESEGNGTIPNIIFEEGEVIVDGLAVLKNYQLIGYINDEDVIPFSWIWGIGSDTVVSIEIEGVKLPYEISEINSKMNFSIENGVLNIKIIIESEGDIVEFLLDDKNKLFDTNYINMIEAELAKKMELEIQRLVNQIQKEYGIDIIGAMDKLKLDDKKIWKLTKDDWEDYFRAANISIESKVNVRRVGLVK